MPVSLDQTDRQVLGAIQQELPLVDQPFAEIGRRLGLAEDEVLKRIGAMKSGLIRQISAIFDSRTLGYQTSLVAARVDEDSIERAADVISAHPGVSHNYRRNSSYNLWYTLAVPPDSRLGLEGTTRILHERCGAHATRLMPSIRMYKIGVKFDVTGESDPGARSDALAPGADGSSASPAILTERDKALVRVLQQDLPISSRPFDAWAASAGVSVSELLTAAHRYVDDKWMRRFSAVLRHRAAGFSANAMGVWAVPAAQADAFGAVAASFEAVSHCYQRPSYPDWPYNLYTMVHAPTPEECEAVLAAISKATDVKDYSALYSTHEYKKVRVKYFAGDIEQWEQQALSSAGSVAVPA
jgi:DNA-binding Lrp family transcriptional regulator